MKLNRVITLCAMAATLASSAFAQIAQDNGGGQGGDQQGQNGGRRFRNNGGGGGQGGQGGQGQGGQGGGNFDPAQMQQRMMDNVRDRLEFTNETDWSAVQPLVQKVMDARRDVGFSGGMRGMFGGRNRGGQGGQGGQGGGRGGMFGQPSPEQDALQKAIDDNAPSSQIKDLLAKYKASQKAKQDKLEAAQADLKKVLSPGKQEAEAYLLGMVN